jgi:hypothetical protein
MEWRRERARGARTAERRESGKEKEEGGRDAVVWRRACAADWRSARRCTCWWTGELDGKRGGEELCCRGTLRVAMGEERTGE